MFYILDYIHNYLIYTLLIKGKLTNYVLIRIDDKTFNYNTSDDQFYIRYLEYDVD